MIIFEPTGFGQLVEQSSENHSVGRGENGDEAVLIGPNKDMPIDRRAEGVTCNDVRSGSEKNGDVLHDIVPQYVDNINGDSTNGAVSPSNGPGVLAEIEKNLDVLNEPIDTPGEKNGPAVNNVAEVMETNGYDREGANGYDDGDETNGSDADGKTTDEEEDNLVDNEGVIDGTVG